MYRGVLIVICTKYLNAVPMFVYHFVVVCRLSFYMLTVFLRRLRTNK